MENLNGESLQWPLTTKPLVLSPLLPLAWTGSWLTVISSWRALGHRVTGTGEIQESVLILSAVVLLVNVYNLVLIYNQPLAVKKHKWYQPLAILNAFTMIASLVLAWGSPQATLVAQQLTPFAAGFLFLNSCQALLGNYFAAVARVPSPLYIPMPAGSLYLIGTSWLFPLVISSPSAYRFPWIILTGLFLLALGGGQLCFVKRMVAPLVTRRSGFYQCCVGATLAASLLALMAGADTLATRWAAGRLTILSMGMAVSLLAAALGTCVIAAMQRYRNDYRYGKAGRHPGRFLCGGIVVYLVAILGLVAVM